MPSHRDAITETLRQRIVAGLHLGALKTGDRLPSLRDLGAKLHADPRVIMAAYQQLASEGLVRLRPRSGVFVAVPPNPADALLPEVASWMVDLFLRGLARGMAPTALRRQARACLETGRVRAVCVECNEDQIHALCRQAHDDYGFAVDGLDLDTIPRRGPLPARAAEADLVLTTRFHAAEAQRLGRRLRLPVVVATLDPAFRAEIRRMLAQGRVWWVCTDERFTRKLEVMFPGAEVSPVVLGRDSLEGVPAEAPVYATRRAAERLPPEWRGGRVTTVPRAFSSQTAHALLTFLVRRNLEATRAKSPRPPSRVRAVLKDRIKDMI
jgi:DNA-binding transcriptional regulator YhcF (GntR family)